MKKILIVEDNIDIHNLIKENLEKESYTIIDAYSGTEAMLILEKEKIDLILLDLMLPGINGEEIVKKVKNIPIIVISAKVSTEDKVNVLLNGANDYITKPFNKDELLARIKVQLRINNNKKDEKELKFKDMMLDQNNHKLYIKDKEIYLTKTEYAILKQLILNPKQVVTKTKLLELISEDTLDCDENSLKVHISNMRKKIRTVTKDEYIESVWGIGFKIHEWKLEFYKKTLLENIITLWYTWRKLLNNGDKMNKTEKLNELFVMWKKAHKREVNYKIDYEKNTMPFLKVDKNNFTFDGFVFDEKDNTVLYILAESNLRGNSKADETFWFKSVYKVENNNLKLTRRIEKMQKYLCEKICGLSKMDISYMNINKRGGFAECDKRILYNYYEKYKENYIWKEIEIINPKVIVFCAGVNEIFEDLKKMLIVNI